MVGTATCGRSAGAMETFDAIKQEIEDKNLDCSVIEVGCIGHCYAEPLVVVSKPGVSPTCYRHVDTVIARRLIRECIVNDRQLEEYVLGILDTNDSLCCFTQIQRSRYEQKIVLKNCGIIDACSIDYYIAADGYSSLRKALQMQPEEIIDEIKRSGLRGRGGAGYSTGQKWETCFNAPGSTKYVICNGDEGDPGAFLDRTLLESDPHSVIEGIIIAGYTIRARQGYIYVRAEYPLAIERIQTALELAKQYGLIGEHILGSSFSFDLKLFQGAGAFVCGEETALISSLEGKPGIPRHRPPYPAFKGLFGTPTLVNNVKTLAYVRHIISKGANWFADIGTKGSKGTAIFALAGKVVNTGLVEVPMGTTLRQIIYDVGGGIANGRQFRAVQIGGPSGGFLPESVLDTPVDFSTLIELGAMMGSGGMIVLDEDDCMVEMSRYFLEFTQEESCGKCTFCRLGTKQMLAMLTDFTKGQGRIEDLDILYELAHDVRAGSLCGLGKTAPNPILTTMRYFRDEYEAHITQKYCRALVCNDLISFHFRDYRCSTACHVCDNLCDAVSYKTMWDGLINIRYNKKFIDQNKCNKCSICLYICNATDISPFVKVSPADKIADKNSVKT
ncbi:MAG: SLBB domain-containing protein [Proteobacteria bacterium]|nr:SLBB domain-containing protein [Pseudomonadota bacterium]